MSPLRCSTWSGRHEPRRGHKRHGLGQSQAGDVTEAVQPAQPATLARHGVVTKTPADGGLPAVDNGG